MKHTSHVSSAEHGRAGRRVLWLCAAVLVTTAAIPYAYATSTMSNNMSNKMTTDPRNDNKRTIEKLFETFNHDDLRPLDELVSAEYVGPQGGTGPAGFRTVTVGLRTAFPDLHYTLDDLLAEKDEVAVRWHWTGTHQGAFRNYAPTGKAVLNNGIAIFRLQGGKIVAGSLETDRLGFLQQIGAVPENVGLGGGPGAPGGQHGSEVGSKDSGKIAGKAGGANAAPAK